MRSKSGSGVRDRTRGMHGRELAADRIPAGLVALVLLAISLGWEPARAQQQPAPDTPHDLSQGIACTNCHRMHSALGSKLTIATTNALVCQSCHTGSQFFPLPDSSMAVAGVGGTSHAWGVSAANSTAGASSPTNPTLSAKLDTTNPLDPKVICSTCHNQHTNSPKYGDLNRKAIVKSVDNGGTGTVTYTTTAAPNPKPGGYLIDVFNDGTNPGRVSDGTLKYRISNDNGLSWWGWSGSAWVAWNPSTPNPRQVGPSGSPVTQNLNDAANVSVTFTDGAGPTYFPYGNRWKLYAGYPFLRVQPDSGDNSTGTKFCRDCHASRAQTYTDVGTYTGTARSHPVGQALNANAGGYDRATPLDVSGAAQSGTPQANYLVLDSLGYVQCTTCHAVHYAPSSSTYDPGGKR